MIHKFRGQEAELTSSIAQLRGLYPLAVVMAPVISLWLTCLFQRSTHPSFGRPQETKKSVIVGSLFQWLITPLATMCFFWLLWLHLDRIVPLLSLSLLSLGDLEIKKKKESNTFQVFPSIEKPLAKSLCTTHLPSATNFFPQNLWPSGITNYCRITNNFCSSLLH